MIKTIKSIKIIDPGASPDVDTDFATFLKAPALDYVAEKYGANNVAAIITPGPFKNKNSWNAVASAYEVPTYLIKEISNLIPDGTDGTTLNDLFDEENPVGTEFREAIEQYNLVHQAKLAVRAQNRGKETGVHACGVIISSENLTDNIPVQIRDDGLPVTQWNYYSCEDLGLIKMDFLGLDTVDLIYNTVKSIEKTKGIKLNIHELLESDLSDPKVFEMFQRGETDNIFQFSGDGVKQLLREVKPTEFSELAAITALYRPGPMSLGLHNDFALRKSDENSRIPVHKDFYGTTVEEILKPNLNALIYQEDIMKIAQQCAGFTSREADDLRKAIGKKNMELMNSLEGKFKRGMINNGYSEVGTNVLWAGFVGFGAYAFNKSHSYSYALNSYQAAYLKAYYPTEFMATVLSQKAKSDDTANIISSAKSLGVKITPPNINESGEEIEPSSQDLVVTFGFGSVKGLPSNLIHSVIEEREKNGVFDSIEMFLERTIPLGMSASNLKKLANVGAFDTLGYSRKGLVEKAEMLCKNIEKKIKSAPKKTTSLFSMISTPDNNIEKINIPTDDYDFIDRISNEAKLLGAYLTANPLDNLSETQSTLESITDKYQYITFLSVKKEQKFGRTVYTVMADNKTSTKSMQLPAYISNRIVLHETLAKGGTVEDIIQKRKIVKQKDIDMWRSMVPLPKPEPFIIYKVTFKKNIFNGNTVIDNIEVAPVSKTGTLLREIHTKISSKEELLEFKAMLKSYSDKYYDKTQVLTAIRVYVANGKFLDLENVLLTDDLLYDLRKFLRKEA